MSIKFNIIEEKNIYLISYYSEVNINTTISASLSISDSVLDRKYQSLIIDTHTIPVTILFTYDSYPINNSKESKPENTDSDSYDTITSSLQNVIIAAVSLELVYSLIKHNFRSLWLFLNTLEILSYIPLLNITIPIK